MRKERDETTVDPNQAALVVTYGNTSRKRRPLDKPVLVLGRMQGCDLPLMSPDVAPVHCVLVRLADGWHIRDCSGHLGTRVNGKSVTEERLADDDHLQIGPFNFKIYLPARKAKEIPPAAGEPALEAPAEPLPTGLPEPRPADVDRLKQSRTNLARLALAYRNQAQAALDDRHELKVKLDRQARDNAADRADIDRDWKQLEKSAQALRSRELAFDHAEKTLQERIARLDEELTARRHHTEDEIRLQRETFDGETTRRREDLQREATLLDEDRADLERAHQELEKTHQELDERLARAEAEAVRGHDERAGLLSARERELERRGKELDAYADSLLRDRQLLREHAERGTTSAPSDDLARQVDELTGKLIDLERDNAGLREQVACVPTQSHILRIEDAALRQARDEAREQLEKLSLVADALQRENEELRKKLTEHSPADTLVGAAPAATVTRADLEAAEAGYAAVQMQLKQLQVERDRERRRLREQIEELQQENQLLRMPASPTVVTPLTGAPEVEELRRQNEILRQRLVELHVQQDVERESWQQARPVAERLGDRASATEEEIRQIVAQIDLLHQENEELRQEALTRQRYEVESSSEARSAALLEHQLQTLQSELLALESTVRERDTELEELRDHIASASDLQTILTLRRSVQRLEVDMKDRDALIEKLTVELDTPAAAANLQNSGGYERELHQFRLELERDRRVLSEQLADVQARQRDIDEAARETELHLSRDRATIARERSELNRLREEIRMDQERLLRLAGSNGRPASVSPSVANLRDALNTRKKDDSASGGSNNGSRRR